MATDEATLTLLLKAKNLASREVDRLGGSLGGVSTRAKAAGGQLAHMGKLAAIAAGTGILALGAAIVGLTEKAAEEQKGIVRMNAALKANDKAFSGNTDRIEEIIAKREGLAFADDQLRDSLTILVTRFHDTDKALSLQTTAMDLARLKGISLTDASELLAKGLDGNKKVLAQLGIELPKTATEQDRLAAIQKAAAGQAEAYGKSAAGAQEAFGIALADVGEDIGSAFLPVMTSLFTSLREDVLPAIRRVAGAVGRWLDENRPLINQLRTFAEGVLATVVDALRTVVTWISNVMTTITSNKDAMNVLSTGFAAIATAVDLAWQALRTTLGWLGDLYAKITANKTVMNGLRVAWKVLGDSIGTVVDALKWIIDNAGKALDALGPNAKNKGLTYAQAHGLAPRPYAKGGLAGLGGPELAMLGDSGTWARPAPEMVLDARATKALGRSGRPGYELVAVSKRDLARMVDEQLYFTLRAAAPSSGRA